MFVDVDGFIKNVQNVENVPINQGVSVPDDGKHSRLGVWKRVEFPLRNMPEYEIYMGFMKGFASHRSPPVCFSEPEISERHISGCCTELRSGEKNIPMCRTVRTLGLYPRDETLSSTLCTFHTRRASPLRIKPGVRITSDHARMSITLRYIPYVLLSLSDRCYFLPIHPEGSKQDSPTNHHTLEHPEVSLRLSPIGFSQTEPGGLSACTPLCCSQLLSPEVHAGVSQERDYHTRVERC